MLTNQNSELRATLTQHSHNTADSSADAALITKVSLTII